MKILFIPYLLHYDNKMSHNWSRNNYWTDRTLAVTETTYCMNRNVQYKIIAASNLSPFQDDIIYYQSLREFKVYYL